MRKITPLSGELSCRRLLVAFLAIFMGLQSLVLAQEEAPGKNNPPQINAVTAPVMVDGKELFRVGGTTSYPARERAETIAKRIKALAADPSFDPKNLQIVSEGDITYVKAGSSMVLGLVAMDAEREGVSLEILAELSRGRIARSIKEYRNDRAPRILWTNSGYALAVTVLTALLIWGILRLFAWLNVLLTRSGI
jgi:hypothetical protein